MLWGKKGEGREFRAFPQRCFSVHLEIRKNGPTSAFLVRWAGAVFEGPFKYQMSYNICSEHEFQLFGSTTSRNSWKLTLKASDRIMQHPKALSDISSGHISQTMVLWISISDLPALALFLRVIEILTSQKLHNIRRIFKCMFTSCPQ